MANGKIIYTIDFEKQRRRDIEKQRRRNVLAEKISNREYHGSDKTFFFQCVCAMIDNTVFPIIPNKFDKEIKIIGTIKSWLLLHKRYSETISEVRNSRLDENISRSNNSISDEKIQEISRCRRENILKYNRLRDELANKIRNRNYYGGEKIFLVQCAHAMINKKSFPLTPYRFLHEIKLIGNLKKWLLLHKSFQQILDEEKQQKSNKKKRHRKN